MQITYATESTPGRVNEDFALGGPNWAVILDGATAPPGVESGCIHDVPWLVHQLAAAIGQRLIKTAVGLTEILAEAIEETRAAHIVSCDLENPDSPSSTVSIVRVTDGALEYLTLGDSPIIVRNADQTITPIIDDRTAHLPGGRPYTAELVRSMRNKHGGFWVASTNPSAAHNSISGKLKLSSSAEIGLFTDGVTRLVEYYGLDWPAVFTLLSSDGPIHLISLVRAAELDKPLPYGKKHDDATAVHIRICYGT
jgi:hypothetical protein